MVVRFARQVGFFVMAMAAFLTVAHAQQQAPVMKIRIVTETATAIAELDDSSAARDFLALLPLKLTLTDYGATEKVSNLPGKLSTKGSPSGMTPVVGDVTYYAPWGNLAIFVKNFSHAQGLVKLGHITSGLEHIGRSGAVPVTIERVAD